MDMDVCSIDQQPGVQNNNILLAKHKVLKDAGELGGDATATIVTGSPVSLKSVRPPQQALDDDMKVMKDVEGASSCPVPDSTAISLWTAKRMGRRISHHGHVDDTLVPRYESELSTKLGPVDHMIEEADEEQQ